MGSGSRYLGSGVSSSLTQGGRPMARAILARRTASSAVRAPEVLGRMRYFLGSSTERMLSAGRLVQIHPAQGHGDDFGLRGIQGGLQGRGGGELAGAHQEAGAEGAAGDD